MNDVNDDSVVWKQDNSKICKAAISGFGFTEPSSIYKNSSAYPKGCAIQGAQVHLNTHATGDTTLGAHQGVLCKKASKYFFRFFIFLEFLTKHV